LTIKSLQSVVVTTMVILLRLVGRSPIYIKPLCC
jgi:hypothetical protein